MSVKTGCIVGLFNDCIVGLFNDCIVGLFKDCMVGLFNVETLSCVCALRRSLFHVVRHYSCSIPGGGKYSFKVTLSLI